MDVPAGVLRGAPLVGAYDRWTPFAASETAALPLYITAEFVASVLLSVVRGEQSGVSDADFRHWFDAVRRGAERMIDQHNWRGSWGIFA